ncbi:SNF2 family N-terminal domain-containing protein [Syncephalis fuscata]|nr:SNF2 family N-terminal domain-containing protein [Syncephalis fuscata]
MLDTSQWIPAGLVVVCHPHINDISTGTLWVCSLSSSSDHQEDNDIVGAIDCLVSRGYVQAIIDAPVVDNGRQVQVWLALTGFVAEVAGRPVAPIRQRKITSLQLRQSFSTLFYYLDTAQDLRKKESLIDLFHALPSPAVDEHVYEQADEYTCRLLEETGDDYLDGMKTQLYGYQKRSLWRMIRQEITKGCYGKPYYMSIPTWRFYRELTFYELTRGGIICEDMGTGKTCICLALILHTKNQLSWPSDQLITCELTDITDATMEQRGPSSLMELLAIKIVTNNLPYWDSSYGLPISLLDYIRQYPPYYYRHEDNLGKRKRVEQPIDRLKIYLASTTLVVVPANLIDQWCNEINKHVEDLSCRLLVVSHQKAELPAAKELIQYDIILLSSSRFAAEYNKGGFKFTGVPLACRCSYSGASMVIDCHCDKESTYISPLLQVHWKRLIVDEGHVMSSTTSDRTLLAAKLTAERRWIATGTPTQNLAATVNRAEAERDDMKRLGGLIGTFLRQPPFSIHMNSWQKRVTKPFFDGELGAVDRVRRILYSLLIRNRPESISFDIQLPPLHERTVTLEFTSVQRTTYNTLIALQHLNAVLTERAERDYFFHPANRKPLGEMISNLWRSCFWFVPTILGRLNEAIHHAEKGLARAEARGYSEADILLLNQVLKHLRQAVADDRWIQLSQEQELGVIVDGLSADVHQLLIHNLNMKCWPQDTNMGIPSRYLIPLNYLRRFQLLALEAQKQSKKENETANMTITLDLDDNNSLLNELGEKTDINISETKANSLLEEETDIGTTNTVSLDSILKETPPKEQRSNAAFIRRRHNRQRQEQELALVKPHLETLHSTTIDSLTSCKLNYLMSRILTHIGREKCILFTQFNNDMYYIYETLCLLRVRCLLYHTQGMSQAERSRNITTFNTSNQIWVIIMDTRLAAYGIDLSSASRVYFVSPVWQNAMMRQAVKRAHRIGQTRPVYVETLVVRGTLEEAILQRRHEMANTGKPTQCINLLFTNCWPF